MADSKKPREIEREIEVERAELAATLDALTMKFSAENVVRTVGDQVREYGGVTTRNFLETVKANPVGAALAVTGIAWLMIGGTRRTGPDYRDPTVTRGGDGWTTEAERRAYEAGRRFVRGDGDAWNDRMTEAEKAAYDRGRALAASAPNGIAHHGAAPAYAAGNNTASGFRDTYPEKGTRSFSDRVAAADEAYRSTQTGEGATNYDASGWSRAASRTPSAAGSVGLTERARDVWGRSVSSVRGRAMALYASAASLRDNLMEGTEDMDDHGKDRVAEARARAYAAQAWAEEKARNARSGANDFFSEQPLVAGAIAVAVGAAVGGMLPRTRREDEVFGAYRDQLFDEAERVFQEERSRIEAAAIAAVDEAKTVAKEAAGQMTGGRGAEETVHDAEVQARSAVDRVAEAAKEAHDRN
ncbi:uncharacterized protein DUF3618 [Hasllibacter halocynthiae]|uniref:Uncharacterized protein DUF3618 n=1 Tax=Hasllibacter halocynthiae TaxID=595589 RepID=A0A2T0X461_9RHOB|nr:DUF3618 domain-containing protein [Hasllibacter halocynthiae]PRY93743.1 uncharacterized protein DUF3618 [Hasllibacter halocynthiae]